MATDPNAIMSPEDLATLHESERIQKLRALPEFNRIIVIMQKAVLAAQIAAENNQQPMLSHELLLRWQERKLMLDTINQYIDNVIAKRRNAIRDLFESVGIDQNLIERHQDASLDFLNAIIKRGTNGNQ
jgi:hypothetical protein